jgi:hypothetical protein
MLITFKQFLEAKKVPSHKGHSKEKVPSANYYPSHGGHSQEKIPSANYYPSHGGHSQESGKAPLKEEAKQISYSQFTLENPNKKIGFDHDDVHNALNPTPEKWAKLSLPERSAVKAYTGSSSTSNAELIDTHHGKESKFKADPSDGQWTKKWKKENKTRHTRILKGLDSLLNRSKVPRNLTVFHGINATSSKKFNPGELASQHSERHIHMPSYISTSVDPRAASSFARPFQNNEPTTTHMLRIHLKRGQKGYKYVGTHSELKFEREGILGRGKILKIGKHPTIVHHPETGGHIHVWDAHVVD